MKTVAPEAVVSLEIVMHDAQGELIHSSGTPLDYLHGGYGGVFEAIERGGVEEGETGV